MTKEANNMKKQQKNTFTDGKTLRRSVSKKTLLLLLMFITPLFLASLSSAQLSSGLLAHYKFDEQDTSGSGTIIDAEDNWNLTNMGADNSTGWFGTGYDFNSGDDEFMNGSFLQNFTELSVSAWWFFDSSSETFESIVSGQNTTHDWLWFHRRAGTTTTLQSQVRDETFIDTSGHVQNDGWKHSVMVWNSTGVSHWVNGSLVGYSTSSNGTNIIMEGFVVGQSEKSNTNNWDGGIDEVSIWDRALTSTEIAELWNGGDGLEHPFDEELIVTLIEPADGEVKTNENVFFNATGQDLDNDLVNASIFLDGQFNQTVNVSGSYNASDFNITLSLGDYNWSVTYCNNASICTSSENRSLTVAPFTVSNFTFNAFTYETAQENFTAIVVPSGNFSITSARLIYNGTAYGSVSNTFLGGEEYELRREISIPLGIAGFSSENRTFHFDITLTDSTDGSQFNFNTSTQQHNVTELLFDQCGGGLTTTFVNFTSETETNLTSLNFKLNAAFDFWLGDGSITKNVSVNSSVEQQSYDLCSNNGNLTVDSIVNAQATNFRERTFFFNDVIYTSTMTTEILYLLDESLGSSVIIQVTDPGLVPLEGLFVNVYRYYPGFDTYNVIEKAKTDEFGQIVARVIEPNTVKYQFEFLDSDNNLLKRTDDLAIACRTTICVIPFVIEDTTDEFERFENITDFDFTFSFSNATKTFVYTWSDTTGDSITSRLLVQKIAFNGTTTICDTTSTSLDSSLSCDVTSYGDGKYRAQAFRQVSGGEEQRISLLNIEVGLLSDIFGREGLFWGFILLFTLVGVGSFNPAVGIVLYVIGFIGLGSVGIISMSVPVFFAQLLIGGLFIWAIRS